MKLNTNLLNLVTQLLQAIEKSGSNDPVYRIPDAEVQRLFGATKAAIIKAQFPDDQDADHVAENIILSLIQQFMTE